MKLDTKHLRYLTAEDWRVLTAVEMGSKNHEVVPTSLIIQLSNLRGGSGVHKCISALAKANLIARMKNAKYDGYRLTYGGLDYLALHTHLKRNTLYSTGPCIGAGKESDIYICASPTNAATTINNTIASSSKGSSNKQLILKIHRLGRISFRSIKTNRDYLRHRTSASWMYMSRLAAQKEYLFMKALHENGFPVPEPVAWSRHTVVMSLVDGIPLRAVKEVGDPSSLYADLIEMILRLASYGLIHGDFNEFNIMIREGEEEGEEEEEALSEQHLPQSSSYQKYNNTVTGPNNNNKNNHNHKNKNKINPSIKPTLIDFPQTLSISHPNADFYFNRDVNCIKTFFARRFHFVSSEPGPFFEEAVKLAAKVKGGKRGKSLDVEVEASGFSRKMARELEKYMQEIGVDGDGDDGDRGEEEAEEESEEEIDVGETDEDAEKTDLAIHCDDTDSTLPETMPPLHSSVSSNHAAVA